MDQPANQAGPLANTLSRKNQPTGAGDKDEPWAMSYGEARGPGGPGGVFTCNGCVEAHHYKKGCPLPLLIDNVPMQGGV